MKLLKPFSFPLFIILISSCASISSTGDSIDINTLTSLLSGNVMHTVCCSHEMTLYEKNNKYFKLLYDIKVKSDYGIMIYKDISRFESGVWRVRSWSDELFLCEKRNGSPHEGCIKILKKGDSYYFDFISETSPYKIYKGTSEIVNTIINKSLDKKIDLYKRLIVSYEGVAGQNNQIRNDYNYIINKSKDKLTNQIAVKKSSKAALKKQINCKAINLTKEKVACYAVIVGPKLCTEAVIKNNFSLTKSIGGRIALSAACTKGVMSTFAKDYVGDDFLWNVADELSETACDNRKNGGFINWAVGGYGCVFSGLSWVTKINMANQCVNSIQEQCESK